MSPDRVVILIVAIFSLVMLVIFAGITFIVWRAFRLLRDTQAQIKAILGKVEAIAGVAQETTAEVGKSVKGVTEIWSQALRSPVVQGKVAVAGLRRLIEVLFAREA
jgi:hypothetical protein